MPPPPRQKHIKKEYSNLVASGKLGSQDSLKAVSTECLASLGRSPIHIKRGGSGKRRNSEEIMNPNFEGVVLRRAHDPARLNRTRPKSFQAPEPTKTQFLCLANRYHQPSIKTAFSLPSLVGDQVKLSPDDDRPFLDPIPRRNKSRSLIVDETSSMAMGHHLFPERNCSSLKDLSVAGTESHMPAWSSKRFRGSVEDMSRNSLCSNSTKSLSATSLNDVSNTLKNKPLPPEPLAIDNHQTSHHLGSNSMIGQLLASKSMHHIGGSRTPLIVQKPAAPPRSSSKNNMAKKLIEDQRSRQSTTSSNVNNSGTDHYRSPPFIYGRLRPHMSFESINEESEQSSTTPIDECAKLPGGIGDHHDHRRSRSEPHDRILSQYNNEQASRSFTLAATTRKPSESENDTSPTVVTVDYDDLSGPEHDNDTTPTQSPRSTGKVNSENESDNNENLYGPENFDDRTIRGVGRDTSIILRGEEKGVRTLTYDSRASSMQSLNSVASSVRSTTSSSSKREQQNLRRAVMNVHGQGPHDLSYEAGAVLYECRPKNKHGLCYGILDNSTEGWFPAESVESFNSDQQL